MLSVRGSISVDAITPGDGPFLVGIAAKQISTTLLEGWLENNGPEGPDKTAKVEIASRGRFIRHLGVLQPQGDGSSAIHYLDNKGLSGLRFSEEDEGAGWTYWLYNQGPAMTTGALFRVAVQNFVRFNPSG